MPGAPEHPVTVLGDLRVSTNRVSERGQSPFQSRPATVADLVSALRAEGVLVIELEEYTDFERSMFSYPLWACDALEKITDAVGSEALLDALAEAQPFPPAGG